jgi:uncharacterized repeat protein (TIGR03803 family)
MEANSTAARAASFSGLLLDYDANQNGQASYLAGLVPGLSRRGVQSSPAFRRPDEATNHAGFSLTPTAKRAIMRGLPAEGEIVRIFAVTAFMRTMAAILSLVWAVVPAPTAQAQKFKVTYSFTGGADGGSPYAGLVLDASGNLYGTTFGGGDAGCFNGSCGTVFELAPSSGGWLESTLHAFTGGSDGGNPEDSLTFDTTGNLYGTAVVGGVQCGHTYGCGVAFELSPGSSSWTETVLHSFQGGTDGYYPIAGLVFDQRGHLFSTTYNGGSSRQDGSVYELTKSTNGWGEKTLYSFTQPANPEAGLILDAAGNLYGTTTSSNTGVGTVFELLRGSWKKKTLYAFNQGGAPKAGLVFDKAGNLYGTTEGGGKYGKGVVFKLAPGTKGKWKDSVLHNFKGGNDGEYPKGTLVLDKAGNLYGTTYNGGGGTACGQGCGTVFKLTPGSGGHWKETILHRFAGGSDGAGPLGLTIDGADNLYGTTVGGGNKGCYDGQCGVVFEITR